MNARRHPCRTETGGLQGRRFVIALSSRGDRPAAPTKAALTQNARPALHSVKSVVILYAYGRSPISGKRDARRAATRALLGAGGVAVFVLLSCGEAVLSSPTRWTERSRFPEDTKHIRGLAVAGGGAVYAAGCTEDDVAVVYRYADGNLARVFRAPYADSEFSAVGCGGGEIWAVGSKVAGGLTRGYCVRSADGEKWEEVSVPAGLGLGGPAFVRPNGVVWLRGGEGESQAIYTYGNGFWRRHDATAGADTLRLALTERGRVYVYYYRNKNLTMMISDDGGNSWARERIPVDYPLYEIRAPRQAKIAAAGEAAFLSIDLHGKAPEFPSVGIIGRDDAPPGEGAYDVAFAAPHGPYFYDIKSMAYRSTADGYIVGPLTSIVLENGVWVKETVPEAWSPEFRLVAPGPSSYWSIVYPSEFSQKPILYEARF
jgi:hypothetical protein